MDWIGKKFAIKAKNGKMKEYKIVDLIQFSVQHVEFFAEPLKGKKKLLGISAYELLNGLNSGEIEVRV